MQFFIVLLLALLPLSVNAQVVAPQASSSISTATSSAQVPVVPFYSQFTDITSKTWQKVGCGVTSLAMVIDYYTSAVPVDTLLNQGIKAGAYLKSAGWTYKGLIDLANDYGLDGSSYDLASLSKKDALAKFSMYLQDGPVIASIHYKFDPASTIPHLVVINAIKDGIVYYNDPAAKTGGKTISVANFQKGWKKRFIVIRPVKDPGSVALAD